MRLTKAIDLTTKEGLEFAKGKIAAWTVNDRILLWSSIPCTGGSQWQYVNEAIYHRKGDARSLKRLRGL